MNYRRLLLSAIGLLLLSLGLAWVSADFRGIQGWGGFLAVSLLGCGILFGGLYPLRKESAPSWVVGLTLGAALLRLGAGVLWFTALPQWGYPTEVQQAGYVMEDAFQRDQAAWELAQSGEALLRAFTAYRGADQYGGLLWISAGVYRYFGGEVHQPLQMVVITAAFSALAVAYTWAFTRRMFAASAAKWAAWGLALYPEAVLLGSSQMREAFVMTLAGGAFYGLVRYRQEGVRGALGWAAAGLGLMLPISPPLTGISLGLLALVGMAMGRWRLPRDRRLWAALVGAAALLLGGVWLGWEYIVPQATAKRFATPAAMFAFWVRQVARWQAYLTYRASGWVQKILRSTPDWFNLPFVVGYGVVRPLLPAALIAGGPPLWQAIGAWRALGWTALLLLLMYAPLRALQDRERRPLALWLSLAVWLTIVIASFWGGGDQWDNPRYRVAFVSLQMALGGWVVASQLRRPDAWLRRLLVAAVMALFWIGLWYLGRYTAFDWPLKELFATLGLGVASAALYILWDWMRERRDEGN